MQKQIRCPDCRQMIDASDLKDHVIMCKLYVTRVYPSTIRLADHMNQDNLRFLLVELDMARDRIKDKLGIKDEAVEIKMRKNQSAYSNGNGNLNGNRVVFGTYQSVKIFQDNAEPSVPQIKQIKQKSSIPIQKKTPVDEEFDLQKYLNRKQQSLQNLPKRQKDKQTKDQNFNKITNQQKQKENDKLIKNNGSNTTIPKVEVVSCSNCKKQMNASDVNLFVYNFTCLHLFCLNCISSYAIDQYVTQKGNLKCLVKDCKAHFEVDEVKQILGEQQFDKFQNQMLRSTMQFVKCCKCSHQYVFSQGNAKDAPKTDSYGKKLTKQQADHYAKNRFVCSQPKCKQQQCKLCHATPYHLGRSCQQNQQFKTAKKCRYCRDVLKKGYFSNLGIKAFDDVCPKKNCEKLTKNACSKIHKCKHPCYGYIRQSKCLPCLNQACIKKQKIVQHDQDEDSYCSICYVQDLKAGPCVMSKCGHIFHYSCLEKRLQIRWLTPRILFGFCHCPLCKEWIQLPPDCPLSVKVNNFKQLHKTIQQRSLNRLKFQKLQKDAKLTDPKSSYYQKPTDYAMAIYAYFQCFKCKKPYFGGRKSCAQMMNEQAANSSNPRHDFDAQKLICPQCCPVQAKNCIKHGKQFIAFKCRFCCNIGMWFCWGSTHFCDDCHKRQLSGQYISKLPKDKLPKCQGKQKCPLGGDHPQNGNQFSLGCSICRNQRAQSARDF